MIEFDTPLLLLDVRSAEERKIVHLPNDRHVPLDAIAHAVSALPHDRPIVAYDHFGAQARRAARFLQDRGFPFTGALEGGLEDYARLADPSVARYPEDDPGRPPVPSPDPAARGGLLDVLPRGPGLARGDLHRPRPRHRALPGAPRGRKLAPRGHRRDPHARRPPRRPLGAPRRDGRADLPQPPIGGPLPASFVRRRGFGRLRAGGGRRARDAGPHPRPRDPEGARPDLHGRHAAPW